MITAGIVTITPDMAEKMIANTDIRNRKVSKKHVDKIAKAIKAGEWVVNGQSIVQDAVGNVLDGNHRLHACVQAGMPIVTIVVRGIEDYVMAQATMDDGVKKRSLQDFLEMRNEELTIHLATALTWLHKLQNYIDGKINMSCSWVSTNGNDNNPSKQQALMLLEANPGIRRYVAFAHTMFLGDNTLTYSMLAPGMLAAVWYITAQKQTNEETANVFWSNISDNSSFLTKPPAAQKVRAKLIKAYNSTDKLTPTLKLAHIIAAWNEYISNGDIVQERFIVGKNAKSAIPKPL